MTFSDLSRHSSAGVYRVGRRVRFFSVVVVFLAVAVFVAVVVPRAGAISDAEELTRFGGEGTGAGQLSLPNGIATDPVTGHVYVLDVGNNRIDEFNPWGKFVKAFGWDVAPGAVNEQQEVRVRAGAGAFRLTFGASSTPDLAFDAPGDVAEEVPGGPVSVEAALNALPSIASGGGSVSVEAVPGTPNGVEPYVYVVVFKGSLAGSNVAQLTAANGTTALSGGNPSTSLEVRTRVDGSAAGTGLESCTTESGCQAGLEGAGAGEFHEAEGVAVDTSGDVYVMDLVNRRVQKFDSAGRFVLMFGGEVDKTTHANLCTAVSGDECGIGVTGIGNGQFNAEGGGGVALCPSGALCPAGALFVDDHDRIQRFSLEGEYESQLPVGSGNLQQLAFDPVSKDLYATFGEKGGGVYKLDSSTGEEIGTPLKVNGAGRLATDSAGGVFAVSAAEHLVLEFDSAGKPLSPASCCTAPPIFGFQIGALGTNVIGDLYVGYANSSSGDSFIRSFGPGPVVFEGPPRVAPTIESEYAVSGDRDSAVVRAQINPHFWSDTTYYVQYGTGDCEVSACVSQPAAPGSRLTDHAIAAPVTSGDVLLSGLQPGTTYHYRFVSESGGGGPVFGPDHTFSTFPVPVVNTDCPNQVFRTGFSALLGDCRAYEMVSPVDKDNGDVLALPDFTGYNNGLNESSTGGDKFTYSSYRAFGDVKGAPYTSQYIASRDPAAGWSTEAISPPQRPAAGASGNELETDYKLFLGDLSSAWLAPSAAEPALAPGAVEGIRNLYRRDDVSGGFEALTTVKPPSVSSKEFEPELQGVSVDGSHVVFRANDKLTPDASSETDTGKNINQLYESYGGGNLRLVSVLPNGTASSQYSSAGSFNGGNNTSLDRLSSVSHAVSDDGSRVYWSETNYSGALGKIYVRVNADREQSVLSGGECVEPDMACTVAVSSKASQFWVATPDGSRALYTLTEGAHAGELDEFNLEEGTSTPVAEQVQGVLGTSEDLSYVYFVSIEALAPGGEAGRWNLYLRHGETTSFIAALSSSEGDRYEIASRPILHLSRVTPDGRHIVFISKASLTGYDNIDAVTGNPDSEVYTYDAGSGRLDCVSCARSGARPAGREANISIFSFAIAGVIPGWENELYASRVLSDDGSRLFFDSYAALVPQDTNGREDVYEWELVGSGDCTAQNPAFSVANGGCVSLISSGESPQDSEFVDASPSGSDVFFATSASLLSQDPGLVDVYDARVDGGSPAPAAPPVSCEGEACQGAPVPPNDSTPGSASFSGPGDLVSGLVTKKNVRSKKSAARVRSASLARALRACRRKAKSKQQRLKSCEAVARKRYGANAKSGTEKSNKGRGK